MRHLSIVLTAILAGLSGAAPRATPLQSVAAPTHADCAALIGRQISGARLTDVQSVEARPTQSVRVAHCRVAGVIDDEIRFIALLPDTWNKRFFMGGGGGFRGNVENDAEPTVNDGYATVGTDTGHQDQGFNATWALQSPTRIENYGHRAVHRTAEVTKAIIRAHYGADPAFSYFYGCSKGGQEALMEAQRYPDDFNGIVACAPAFNFINIIAGFVRTSKAAPVITPDNLRLLQTTILAKCDQLDGVEDDVLEDPRRCDFTVKELPLCPGDAAGAACVTRAQRAAIDSIYAPVVINGATVYPGYAFGGESWPGGWGEWFTLQSGFATGVYQYFAGIRDWDASTYDLSRWERDLGGLREALNADNPDLSRFKARGGRLILAHGWADAALTPLATINYYEQVEARDLRVRDFARLFMMPGVLHCLGGPGPDHVDWPAAITEWVEHGHAPERLIAEKRAPDGSVSNARPLCPYPQLAIYDGIGKSTGAASYTCGR